MDRLTRASKPSSAAEGSARGLSSGPVGTPPLGGACAASVAGFSSLQTGPMRASAQFIGVQMVICSEPVTQCGKVAALETKVE